MIVKKYLVDSIEHVHVLIREELGPNAVILTSKHIQHKGWKKCFFTDKIEVVAAVEEDDQPHLNNCNEALFFTEQKGAVEQVGSLTATASLFEIDKNLNGESEIDIDTILENLQDLKRKCSLEKTQLK